MRSWPRRAGLRRPRSKLGLKSNVLGTVHTDAGVVPLSAKARKAFKRITRKGGRLTIFFQAKAVGPDGQVFKKNSSAKFKANSEENDF